MNMDDLTRMTEKLSARDSDGGQKLPSKEIVRGVLHIAESKALGHSSYQHYTTLDAFRKIFDPVAPGLLLSRIDSLRLNDRNEWRKYAARSIPNAFIGCFSHASSESANLWWLYAYGNQQSLRITFPRDAFHTWCDGLSRCAEGDEFTEKVKRGGRGYKLPTVGWMKPIVSDVIYLAVKGELDRYPQDRQNVMSFDDCHVHVSRLQQEVFGRGHIGRFKDYEWKDERETRVILQMRNFDAGVMNVGVPLGESIIPKLRITVGPWAMPKDVIEIRREVEAHLCPFGWKLTKKSFRLSVLSGAMSALRQRGSA